LPSLLVITWDADGLDSSITASAPVDSGHFAARKVADPLA